MKVVIENSTAEIVEKKSRFIANVFYIESEDEAEKRLNEIRKKYYDAKHNCFAYILGKNGAIVKSSDDGEPQGTAGHPMLDILKGENLTNCIAIVTRYFGGTLLGTGGLVRAYGESLKKALAECKYSYIYDAYEVSFSLDYDDYGRLESIIQNTNQNVVFGNMVDKSYKMILPIDKVYEDKVRVRYLIDDKVFDRFKSDIESITRGNVSLEKKDKRIYYIDVDKKIKYIYE